MKRAEYLTDGVAAYYTSIGDDVIVKSNNHFRDKSKPLWLNLGYWKDASTYPDACRDMALLLGRSASLCDADQVLDVGFGFGEQAYVWVNEFKVKSVVGINITPLHIKVANERLTESGLQNKIEFKYGNAMNIEFEDNRFDKVLALECAFNFPDREVFFREAYRVLKPGGILAIADMIPLPGENQSFLWKKLLRRMFHMHECNMYDRTIYTKKLESHGFEDITANPIGDFVYSGMTKYFFKRVFDRKVRMHDVRITLTDEDLKHRKGTKFWGLTYGVSDYVIFSARKPLR